MGLAGSFAYSLLGVLISLLFLFGVILQAYGSFVFGVVLVAVAVLLQAGREAWAVWGMWKSKERGGDAGQWMVRAGLAGISGLLGFAFITLFRGLFGSAWLIFLVNDAVITLVYVVPAMVKAGISNLWKR